MKYCEKCKKAIPDNEKTYRGLCFKCYQDYLFDKIDNSDIDDFEDSVIDTFINSIINFIKKIFSKHK